MFAEDFEFDAVKEPMYLYVLRRTSSGLYIGAVYLYNGNDRLERVGIVKDFELFPEERLKEWEEYTGGFYCSGTVLSHDKRLENKEITENLYIKKLDREWCDSVCFATKAELTKHVFDIPFGREFELERFFDKNSENDYDPSLGEGESAGTYSVVWWHYKPRVFDESWKEVTPVSKVTADLQAETYHAEIYVLHLYEWTERTKTQPGGYRQAFKHSRIVCRLELNEYKDTFLEAPLRAKLIRLSIPENMREPVPDSVICRIVGTVREGLKRIKTINEDADPAARFVFDATRREELTIEEYICFIKLIDYTYFHLNDDDCSDAVRLFWSELFGYYDTVPFLQNSRNGLIRYWAVDCDRDYADGDLFIATMRSLDVESLFYAQDKRFLLGYGAEDIIDLRRLSASLITQHSSNNIGLTDRRGIDVPHSLADLCYPTSLKLMLNCFIIRRSKYQAVAGAIEKPEYRMEKDKNDESFFGGLDISELQIT